MSRARAIAVGLASGLAGATGCAEEACDPEVEDCSTAREAGDWDGTVSAELISHGCDDDQRWVDAMLAGSASVASLEMAAFDSDDRVLWSERHALPIFDEDPQGWWQDRYLALTVADTSDCASLDACADRFDNGVSTLFSCDDTDVTLVLRLTDALDTTVRRCWTWGSRPDLVSGCTTWEPL
jgi:hypothetical protein